MVSPSRSGARLPNSLRKTQYMAYQSVLTNGTVYVVAFLLYANGVWQPTFESVMGLFALGILVDTFLTMFFLLKALYIDPVGQSLDAL